MESAKMGKCGCGPFKIHKKKLFALLRVITKVFLLCDKNASKMGKKTLCPVPKENHANASWNASWTEYLQYLRRTEKQWHNMSRCFGNWHTRYELESSSDCWIDFICCVCCFSERWSFFTFSSETLDWHCRYTFVITRINAITLFLCIFNG